MLAVFLVPFSPFVGPVPHSSGITGRVTRRSHVSPSDALQGVHPKMLASLHDPQVRGVIVEGAAINVMDMEPVRHWPVNMLVNGTMEV